MKQSGHINPSGESGTGYPVTSNCRRTPPNKHGEHNKDWVKKCMEYRVEGRRPVVRPRKTWLESVEADMTGINGGKRSINYNRNVAESN